ncbi:MULTISPECIES: DUF1284 domain-containing protein [Alphaproteobacteria]|uniref:(2Fe-2S) ferredoxin n=2 Tax=Alphaproteobacteria TaxID=28211 RepID=A0A512HFH4_9HYPH|nr:MULTISPECIES: DUF1284 domain-containing protein [Alphaproteobacteria]GEO84197.1 (2Fe-2S) ferredoxin [Ciceribacter naphthalenivorans]GLR24733.1 (2Fe-2S) ferredoxin [Ciceribacter naphthalenivorans]GLT07589.1 (2Fe-2S) ferredoxin [Sphingomonas psychrolutea]
MTVRLRAHHLLCMLTYIGKGYSPAFVENYEAIAALLSAGEEIELVAGPDDICRPLLGGGGAHCLGESVLRRDDDARNAVSRLLSVTLSAGSGIVLSSALLDRLRASFATGRIRSACSGCEWSSLCDEVAAAGYVGAVVARLSPG